MALGDEEDAPHGLVGGEQHVPAPAVRGAAGSARAAGGAGLGAAGTLIAAHLIGAYRFPAAEAVAWVRMVHPAADPRRHRGFLLANAARIAA